MGTVGETCGLPRAINDRPYGKHPYEKPRKSAPFSLQISSDIVAQLLLDLDQLFGNILAALVGSLVLVEVL